MENKWRSHLSCGRHAPGFGRGGEICFLSKNEGGRDRPAEIPAVLPAPSDRNRAPGGGGTRLPAAEAGDPDSPAADVFDKYGQVWQNPWIKKLVNRIFCAGEKARLHGRK